MNPGAQGRHAVDPGVCEYVPLGHGMQSFLSLSYVPTGQVEHAEVPGSSATFPSGQSEHDVAPSPENFPLGHNKTSIPLVE
jgi:hypothetical protein